MSSFRRKKDLFYVILKMKYSFRRDSNPRSMGCEASDLPLSHLTCWWMGIKIAYIKYTISCLQFIQVYAIVINYKLWTISNKMLCKNISKINISFHTCLFDKNVPRMLQQEGILSVLKILFSRVKWVEILWRQVIIIENQRSLLYQ